MVKAILHQDSIEGVLDNIAEELSDLREAGEYGMTPLSVLVSLQNIQNAVSVLQTVVLENAEEVKQ